MYSLLQNSNSKIVALGARQSRRGLTLLELVVVLTILAALGGLLIPLFNVYRDQTSDSSAIDSIAEISKIVEQQAASASNPGYPNNLDSLIEDGSTTIFTKLSGVAELSALTLDANQVSAFATENMTSVYDMNNAAANSATFEATLPLVRVAVDGRALATSGTLAQVADAAILRELEVFPGTTGGVQNVFVAFGFGDRNSLVGDSIQEAPYHMPTIGNPNSIYSRYLVVFEVPGTGATGGDVTFRGTVLMTSAGIRGQQSLAQEFYNVQ